MTTTTTGGGRMPGVDSRLEIDGAVVELDTHQGTRATSGPITLKPCWAGFGRGARRMFG